MSEKRVIGPVLDVLIETMPRDNLLSSACLEFFEFIRKENIKDLVKHIVDNYREKIQTLAYLDLFRTLIIRYDQTGGFSANMDYFVEVEEEPRKRPNIINPKTGGLMEHLAMDQAEEEYWNTSDDEEDLQAKPGHRPSSANGESPNPKALVDYASDEEGDENLEAGALSADEDAQDNGPRRADSSPAAPPERLSEKRRREEDEEDDLSKMVQHKRRNSTSASANTSAVSGVLRKKSVSSSRDGAAGPRKIAISLSSNLKAGNGQSHSRPHDEA